MLRSAVMAASEQWSSDANDAVRITLVRPGQHGVEDAHESHPTFTYPIFGEEERIFGYKDLDINIRFAAHDLQPNVIIAYDRKFTAVGETAALDLNATLKKWLPASAFAKAGDFERRLQKESSPNFKPPGIIITTYKRKARTFEIWAGSLLDPAVRETIDRMQIFISFFIEAGMPINTKDVDWTLERWKVYFIYEKINLQSESSVSPYSFVGYSTTYHFYTMAKAKDAPHLLNMSSFPPPQDLRIADVTSRLRISQFLILPPYQHHGHGSVLYSTIYAESMANPNIVELSVEDPSEEFDALRDINDWRVLEPKFRSEKIAINVNFQAAGDKRRPRRLPSAQLLDVPSLKNIRSSTKIAKRQFARQLEMYLLSLIPFTHRAGGGASLTKLLIHKAKSSDLNDKAYYWWRLILKQRIYKKNRDQLQQLDLQDRQPKVEDSARAQEDEYEKLLLTFATLAEKHSLQNGKPSTESNAGPIPERKRKVIEDEDEDEDEEESTNSFDSGSKRVKT